MKMILAASSDILGRITGKLQAYGGWGSRYRTCGLGRGRYGMYLPLRLEMVRAFMLRFSASTPKSPNDICPVAEFCFQTSQLGQAFIVHGDGRAFQNLIGHVLARKSSGRAHCLTWWFFRWYPHSGFDESLKATATADMRLMCPWSCCQGSFLQLKRPIWGRPACFCLPSKRKRR